MSPPGSLSWLFQSSCQISYILKTIGPWKRKDATGWQVVLGVLGAAQGPPMEIFLPAIRGAVRT